MQYCVVPKCVKMACKENTAFTLTRLCEIQADEKSQKAKNDFLRFLAEAFNIEPLGTGKEKIVLQTDKALPKDEGYVLTVQEDTVTITGKDEAGVLYGVQTLKQLLLQGDLILRETYIEDYPRFSHRGFMLDTARHFFTKEAVFHFLQMMAFHKLNVFHIHLSDDQGFRAQFESKLLLTEIGSYRSHTNFGSTPHSGYYTKQDLKEIVDYAHNLCIKVIPEIDTPGHTVSMIASYPELSCFERKLVTATRWGIMHDVLCVGKESTYDFMFSLFDELLEVFTDGIVHIGGDEVPTTRWKLCEHCQNKMKEQGFKDESELHTYYLDRIGKYLSDKGVKVIMWNDKVKSYMVNKNISWQLRNSDMSEANVVSEINNGRDFVVSLSDFYYFDLPYAITDLEKCYSFDAVYEGITPERQNGLLGVEACLWSEYVPSMEKAHYLTYPRIGAFSETAWTSVNNKSYESFKGNLDIYCNMLYAVGVDAARKKDVEPIALRKAVGLLRRKTIKLPRQELYTALDNAVVNKKHSKRKK